MRLPPSRDWNNWINLACSITPADFTTNRKPNGVNLDICKALNFMAILKCYLSDISKKSIITQISKFLIEPNYQFVVRMRIVFISTRLIQCKKTRCLPVVAGYRDVSFLVTLTLSHICVLTVAFKGNEKTKDTIQSK